VNQIPISVWGVHLSMAKDNDKMRGLYVSYKLTIDFCSSSCDGKYAHACSPHVAYKLGCDINVYGCYV